MSGKSKVIIIGGGFGGLSAAQALKSAPVDVTLIDRRNYHLFQPLLYQVATGSLSPGEVAAPLRGVLSRQKNTRVLLGDVLDIDPVSKQVVLADGATFDYDSLIVSAGSQTSYYGHDVWSQWAPGLKSIEEATTLRHKILYAFEVAERLPDPVQRLRSCSSSLLRSFGPQRSLAPRPPFRKMHTRTPKRSEGNTETQWDLRPGRKCDQRGYTCK